MAFKARSVRTVVLAILALINLPTTVRFHVLLQLRWLPKASPATLALKGQILRMQGQDMATQGERVGRVKVAVPTLVHLVAFVCLGVLLQLRGPVEAFLTHVTLMGEVLGVNGNNVSFKVAGVGALVLTVRTLVGLVALHHLYVTLEFPCVSVGLGTVAALEGQVCAMLALDVSLKIGLVGTSKLAVRTLVGFFPRVGPHVFLKLRRVTEAFSALDTHMCKVLTVDCQQVAVEQPLFGRLIFAVLAVMKFGLSVLDDELIRAQGAGLMVASCVLRIFWRSLSVMAQKLVTLQVIVETDLLVGGKVTVGTLVLLLEQMVWVVFHMAFEKSP